MPAKLSTEGAIWVANSSGVRSIRFTSTGMGFVSPGVVGGAGWSGAGALISRRRFSTMPDTRDMVEGVGGCFSVTILRRMFSS